MVITNPKVLMFKGLLFLFLGILAGSMVVFLEGDRWFRLVLLMVTIWASCRFYYFAFYVIHHYADPLYKYSGILHLIRYLWRYSVTELKEKKSPIDS